MKFLKQISILVVSILALVLIIALFVEKEYDINRSIIIKKSNSEVFNFVKSLENHETFSVWQKKDPNIVQTFTGASGEVGSIYTWSSEMKDVGQGEQEIKSIEENERITCELRFIRPDEMIAESYMTTSSPDTATGTNITWGIKGKSAYPWNFFMLFFDLDAQLGPDLQEGLENLKQVLETND